MCACACPSWLGWAGWPPGRFLVRLTLSCGRSWCAYKFFCSAPPGLGCPVCGCCWVFLFFFAAVVSGVLCFPARAAFRLGVLWSSRLPPPCLPPPPFLAAPLSLAFRGFRPGVPWALALLVPSPGFPLRFFLSFFVSASLPPPPFSFFFFAVLLFFLGFLFFFLPLLPFFFCLGVPGSWCLGRFVCPGLWACAGVCCCARCAPAGAGVRLCCVVGCSLVVPVLCVLLPVVLRCCGVLPVFPGGAWCACVGPGPCSVLLAPVAVAWSSVVACGFVLSCSAVPRCPGVPPVVWCAAVCVVSCWWCDVVSFALAGAACCCLWLPPVLCWVWSPAVVFRWFVLSRVLLLGRMACCPAVCCGLLWCPAPLCCVLCSVVLCCRVAPCCGALLSVFLCWWCCVLSLCVRCCVALRVVLFGAGLVRAVVRASCCGVSLGVLWCGGAVLVCRGVLLCRAVCGMVLRRLVVPWCWAVLCVSLCCGCFFFL